MKFLVINGPNLDMLGTREPEIYGSSTLESIKLYTQEKVEHYAKSLGNKISVDWFQSNSEGEIVSRLGTAFNEKYDAIIINPAAYTHTSIAIADALKIHSIPIIEVHLTNTHGREKMRQNKITTSCASQVIEGAGKKVYSLAMISLLMS